MTNYVYKGYGVTDENGVAKLEYDENGDPLTHSYTGVGAGEIDVVASLDNPIGEGSLVSETYSVWDCLKFDKGILNDADTHDIYDTRNANSLLTRTSEYSELTEVNSGTTATLKISNLPTACGMDLEYCQADGGISQGGMNFFDSTSYKQYISLEDMGFTTSAIGVFHNLRLTFGNGNVTLSSLDDPTKTVTKQYNGDINALTMTTNGTITEIRIRNVKIYSI